MPLFPDWCQRILEHGVQELFDLDVAESAASVMILELVQIPVFGQELFEVLRPAEGVQIRENRIALALAGIVDIQMPRVGIHALYLFADDRRLV